MAGLNLRARLDQGIRKLHPLPIHQITSFPSAQLEMSVVLENKWRRLARNHLAVHLGLSALVAAGKVHSLRLALRCKEKYEGCSRDTACQRQANPGIPHGNLHFQVA